MILVIGDAIIDRYEEYTTVRQSPEGDFPIVELQHEWTQPGGAEAVAAMCCALGSEVKTLTTPPGNRSVKRRVFVDGKQAFRHDEDAWFPGVVDWRIRDSLACEPCVILLSDYGKGFVTEALMAEIVASHALVIADPYPGRRPKFYGGCDAVTPNRREWGSGQWKEIFAYVCHKFDRDGMHIYDDGQETILEAENQNPVDVCGAGDQVLAMIGVAMERGMSFTEACKMANRAAGIKCGRRGAVGVEWGEVEVS